MIILARESRGLSQADLAGELNISPANLSKIENGDIQISDFLLDAITTVTRYPRSFFNQEGEILPTNLAYRKRQKVQQKLITPVESKINILTKHVEALSGAGFPSLNLPFIEVSEINTPQVIATQLRKKWKLKDSVIYDLVKEMELNGIIIISFDFQTERIDSRTMLTKDNHPIIFLNSCLPGDRQRFSLAFELAQLIMHTFCIVPFERDIKHEANLFAAEFLMPEKEIRKDFVTGINISLLGELKRKWKVSMISLLYRSDDLGFLTPNQKRYFIQQFNQLKIRRTEPSQLNVEPEKPELFKSIIFQLQKKANLNVIDMASLFHLETEEFLEYYS